jgi:hypothetical protein
VLVSKTLDTIIQPPRRQLGREAAPVTAQNLVLRMTGDLPALCGTSRSDPGATAVIHF